MKYIKLLVAAFVAALFVTAASAAPSTNLVASTTSDLTPWTFAVSGQGSSALNNNSTYKNSTVGGEFQIGYNTKIVLPAEVGIRQSINYSDASGATWNFSTKAYSDWQVVRLGNIEADAGGNIGDSYGSQKGNWTVSPEVVARLYLKKDVDLFGRVEYPYNITTGTTENTLPYTLGLRVRF